jgi:hypothetical protein
MKGVKSVEYGDWGASASEKCGGTPDTHQFSPSPLAGEYARGVSPKRIRHERVSSYGAPPVPIVACAEAAWGTRSAWYGPSTEGSLVVLDVLDGRTVYWGTRGEFERVRV